MLPIVFGDVMSVSPPLAFLPGSPGAGELLIIFIVVLVLFGPKRLPSIARSIGRMLEEIRRASQDFRDQLMRADDDLSDNERTRAEPVAVPDEPDQGPGENDEATGGESPREDAHDIRGSREER